MAVATHLPSDGEFVRFGDLEDHPDAILFRDASGTQVVLNCPSGDTLNIGIGDTSEVTLDATNLTVVGSHLVVTAGDVRIAAANARLGPVNAFGTTEPTQTLVMEAGTAPVGTITTSGGLFSSATVVRKIIADGSASNVET